MFDRYFDDCIDYINSWKPQNCTSENQFRDDLLEYLRDKFDKQTSLLSNDGMPIRREHSASLCDIGVGRKVGIELKLNLRKKKDADRLFGRVYRHKKEYNDIIILLIGNTNQDILEGLKEHISDLQRGQDYSLQQQRFKIITKRIKKSSKTEKHSKGKQQGGSGYSLPEFKPYEFKPPKFNPPKFDFKNSNW